MKRIIIVFTVLSLTLMFTGSSVLGVTSNRKDKVQDENPYVDDRNDFGGFEKKKNGTGVEVVEVNDTNQEKEMEERIEQEKEEMGETVEKKPSSSDNNKSGGNNMLYMVVALVFGIVIGVVSVVSYQNKKFSGEEEIKL